MTRKKLYEIVGWTGTMLVIASYMFLSLGYISGSSYTYHLLVLFGSIGVAIVSFIKQAYQPLAINAFFIVIAIVALARITYFH